MFEHAEYESNDKYDASPPVLIEYIKMGEKFEK